MSDKVRRVVSHKKVLVIVLVVKPTGLLGKKISEKG